jgi:hypothetical protein
MVRVDEVVEHLLVASVGDLTLTHNRHVTYHVFSRNYVNYLNTLVSLFIAHCDTALELFSAYIKRQMLIECRLRACSRHISLSERRKRVI